MCTFRAAKGAFSGKIKSDFQAFLMEVNFGCAHLPWRCQTRSHLKQANVSHNENKLYSCIKNINY